MKNANNPAYLDPSKPPFPAQDGWIWRWRPVLPAKWCARRHSSRINTGALTPRRINAGLHIPVFRRVSDLMFPWYNRWDYPGIYAVIKEITGTLVVRQTVWRWRAGKTLPPIEVCEALATFAEDRAKALQEAAAALRALPRGPGRQGGMVPYRLRAARLEAEERQRAREIDGPIPMPNVPPPPPVTGCRAFVEARLGRRLE
jgi:hypothetical protein